MEIIPFTGKNNEVKKPELEKVEREKQEYKIIGRYLRTPGLSLFAYDSKEDKIILVKPKERNTIVFVTDKEGLKTSDISHEYLGVVPGWIYFEALNRKNAEKRVKKWKEKKIKYLENLREPNDGIQLVTPRVYIKIGNKLFYRK